MDINNVTKKYSNGEVTVVWQPSLCIHSKKCWKSLPAVFNPQKRPWVDVQGAGTKKIIAQVETCPSGALSYFMNNPVDNIKPPVEQQHTRIEVTKNGPLLVHGEIIVKDKHGNETNKSKVTALCRCGQSANKPYCDGTHNTCGFKDE